MVEERPFASVTGAPPPRALEEVMAELEASKKSDLRVRGIAFVISSDASNIGWSGQRRAHGIYIG